MSTTGINLSGMNLLNGQGVDVSSLVSQLVTAAKVPENQWQDQQTSIKSQIADLKILSQNTTTLTNDLNALKDSAGAVTSRSVTTSNSALVSASAAAGSAVGSHTVVVNNLASTSSYYTDQVASADTQIANGTFNISIGTGPANTITIDSTNNTLTGLAAAINQKNIGVNASVITDANGSRLALVSQSSGAAGDINISNASTGLSFGFTKAATGTNASLTVDGVPVSSASNTVTGAVAGLTLNLNGADKNTSVSISVSPNTGAVISAVTSFVNDFNTLVGNCNQEYTFNGSTKTAGPLSGDSTLQMLQSTLLNAMGYSSNASAITSLSGLGITMNNDGTLTLDSSVLTNAANNNYDAVQKFLQGDGTTGSGFASSFASQLDSFTDASEGAFTLDINGRNASVKSLQDQIDDFETYMTGQKAMWTAQYVQMNVLLQTLPAQLQQIQAALGNKDYANT